MPDRTKPAERHRRMVKQLEAIDNVEDAAQLIATVERDAFARGVEACAAWLRADGPGCALFADEMLEALLPEPPRVEACTCLTMSVKREVLTPRLDCPIHAPKNQ